MTTGAVADIKKDMEELQKIIFNPNSTEKEIADANIKLEKVMVEYEQSPEGTLFFFLNLACVNFFVARAEAARLKDERKKKHDPLNKEALAKLKLQYNAENVKKTPALLTRVQENPELRLLFLDQDQILRLHQNDFKVRRSTMSRALTRHVLADLHPAQLHAGGASRHPRLAAALPARPEDSVGLDRRFR